MYTYTTTACINVRVYMYALTVGELIVVPGAGRLPAELIVMTTTMCVFI